MRFNTTAFITALVCCCSYLLSAQNPNLLINYEKSDSLFVCGSDTFTVTIKNNGGPLPAGAALTLALPSGIQYLAGTVSGASQQNITDLKNPVFGLPAVPANGNLTVQLLLSADCAAAVVLDAGGLFIANIAVTAPNVNTAINTTSIPVETGLLLIESVDNELLEGEKGDTLYRKICVRNTRLGKIGSLHFEDAHQPGMEIAVATAATQNNGTAFFEADFDPAIFATTGNGDGWLDLDESVCFTERIILTDCGTPEYFNASLLRVGWGCGPELCRYDSLLVNVKITPSTKIPKLVFSQIWNPTTDHCAVTGSTTGVKVSNIGSSDAEFVSVTFEVTNLSPDLGIKTNSFRVVSSSGQITPIMPNLSTSVQLPNCQTNVFRKVTVTIPSVLAKDSVELLFEVLSCIPTCEQELPSLKVEYFYNKPCPVNGFISETTNILADLSYLLRASINLGLGACVEAGQTYPAKYKIKSKRLLESNGFLNIDFELPPGITLDNSCGTKLGNSDPFISTTTPTAAGGSLLHLVFTLPISADSAFMNFCIHYECDSMTNCVSPPSGQDGTNIIYAANCVPCFEEMVARSYWAPEINTPYECAVGTCNSIFLALDTIACADPNSGPPDTIPITPGIPESYRWKMFVQRTNFGLKDQDDNRLADDGSTAPADVVRRDRYLPGDTSRVTYCGVLDSGEIQILPRVIWHEVVLSDALGPFGNDRFSEEAVRQGFTNHQKLRFIRDSMRIHYADGSQYAYAVDDLIAKNDQNAFVAYNVNTYPPSAIDLIVTQRHTFQVSLPDMFNQGLLPKPTLNAGDSIFFYTDFKMDMNFNYRLPGQTDPPLIGFRTAVDHSGLLFAWNAHPFERMQYSGFVPALRPNTFSIKPCENSQEAKTFRLGVRIARENLFPFEVRPLAKIAQYRQSVPDDELTLVSAKLNYLVLQDSITLLNGVTLPYTQQPGYIDVDFSPAFTEPIDEGFALSTNLTFGPDCHFAAPDTGRQWINTQYLLCLEGKFPLVKDSLTSTIGFYANHPELSVSTTDSVVNSTTRSIEVEFTLKNPVISPAAFPWLTVQSPSGNATDFNLFKLPDNQAVTPQNGIYNLSPLVGFTEAPFQLTGNFESCETDSLLLIFGWDCAPVTDLNQASCYRDTYLILLNLEKPELELNILQEPASITLCDTSDYFEFELYNAKIGAAYDLFGTVNLPDGMRVVAGSSQLYYPPVGAWVDIDDPEVLTGNLYRWNVSENQAFIAANGLPGVNLSPQNTVRIRFKTLAECGFVANTQNIYGTYGKEACGRSTNILNKPGERINIVGLNPTYGVVADLQAMGNQASVCGSEQEFQAKIILLGTPSVGDSAVVTLPLGAAFVVGSYVPGVNAPVDPPSLINGGFRVALPILTGGGTMQFTFKVVYGPGAGCVDQIISLQTRVRTQAFCQSLGAPCDVYVSTGEYSLSLHIEHPERTLGPVQITQDGQDAGISVTVTNTGDYAATGTTVEIWQDLDGSQTVTTGDVLLQTLLNNQTVNPGGSILVEGTLTLSPDQSCNLMVVLPADENCACVDEILPINELIVNHLPLVFCTTDPVLVGVDSLTGFFYQWQNTPGITCPTCATTHFQPDPNLPPGQSQLLTLVATAGVCTVTHQFEVTFGAMASIDLSNATICRGLPVTLEANPPNAIYVWQGPGIQTPGNAVQTVTPGTSGEYTLLVTLPNGCTATASALITVLPTDTVYQIPIVVCEGAMIDLFGNQVSAVSGLYHQSGQNMNGCDSTNFQQVTVLPKAHTEETITFCLGDTLMVFDTIPIIANTTICHDFQGINTCDSTHCISALGVIPPELPAQDTIFSQVGQSFDLGGIPGFFHYTWTPMPDPPCLNCPTLTITPDSAGYFEYLLTVDDANGCPGAIVWRVVVFPPCDAVNVKIPNAFTPNNDGANDVFRPIVSEGGELIGKLTIYDRWGEKVFENYGDVYWDGTIDGKPASSDVYVYIIEVACSGLTVPRVGEVTLLR